MFKDYLYLDSSLIEKYADQLCGRRIVNQSKAKRTKVHAEMSGGLGPVQAKAEIDSEDASSLLSASNTKEHMCDLFEKQLTKLANEDYFDYIQSGSTTDLQTVPPMSILRVLGRPMVPEAFDMLATIKQYMPYITTFTDLSNSDELSNDILVRILHDAQADIPITIDVDGMTLAGKLNANYLIDLDSADIDSLEDEDVIILCKIESHADGENVLIYDPLRDFMKLNRALRRQITRTKELEPIRIDGPVIKVQMIAMYH